VHGKAARSAAAHVLAGELGMRARRVAAAQADAFKIDRMGQILWRGEEIARLEAAEDPLKPSIVLLVDEHLSGPDRDKIQARLETWLAETVADKLKPLVDLSKAEDVTGLARGIAFQLKENFGVLKREAISEELKSLDQTARAQLRRYGVRFGAFNIYFPLLLKPAPADLILSLWSLKHAAAAGLDPDKLPEPPRAGLTSAPAAPDLPEAFYRVYGYHVCGPRAVRFDMLERLADMIRPLLAWRSTHDPEARPPNGSTGDGGFTTTPEMMSILGCSPDELGKVLKALGFKLDRRPIKPVTAKPASAVAAVPEETPAAEDTGEAVSEPPTTPDVAPNVAEAVAADAVAGAAEAHAGMQEAEVQYEEVWRPRRHHRGEGSEHGQGRPEQHRHRDRRHGRRPGGGADRTAPAPAQAPLAGGATAETGTGALVEGQTQTPDQRRDRGRDRHRHDRGNRDRAGGGPRGEGQRSEGARPEGRRDEGRRGERGGDRRRNEDRGQPRAVSAAPPRKAGADADSPFASLLALRSQLEQAQRDKGS
jgi:ATP-dependent RNA helicase SUPV3L1/SUV3